MKRLLTLGIVLGFAVGVEAGIANSRHDLSSGSTSGATISNTDQICVFCHTPHKANTSVTGYLWNRPVTTNATFATYASTSTTQATDHGTAIDSTTTSWLCMTCHDGTVAINSLENDPYSATTDPTLTVGGNVTAGTFLLGGSPNLGNTLTDDHPVNFTYDTTLSSADTGLAVPAGGLVGTLPLFSDKVQCGTCHNVHDDTNGMFLRVTAAASAICTTCHTNK